jgi:site-specific recombinase XerC
MSITALKAEEDMKEMAETLSAYPTPDKWTREQKAQAVQFAALLDTAQKLIAVAGIAGIEYQAEKEAFIDNAGRTGSVNTRLGYRAALDRLDAWVARQNLNPLELTPAQADDFIYSLRGARSAASIRLDVSAASSFFTWLERRHAGIKNPFRGTKARPAKKRVRAVVIPTEAEVATIVRELPKDLSAAVSIMAYRGLRAGIFPTLSIVGDRFYGNSKGKDVAGKLPDAALAAVKAAALPLRKPFAGTLPNTLEKRIARAIKKLHTDGKVQAGYSAHDLRHFFAVTEYRKTKDIYRVSGLLDHASLQITENYLKGLGEIE